MTRFKVRQYLICTLGLLATLLLGTAVVAEESLEEYGITGPACSLDTFGEKPFILCSHLGAHLTVMSGQAASLSLRVPSETAGGEYLIQRIEDDSLSKEYLADQVSKVLAVCATDIACSGELEGLPAINEDRCLAESYLAEAITFFEFDGEVSPVLRAGNVLVCRDHAGFFIAFESSLSTSFVIDSEDGPTQEEIIVFVFATFEVES